MSIVTVWFVLELSVSSTVPARVLDMYLLKERTKEKNHGLKGKKQLG